MKKLVYILLLLMLVSCEHRTVTTTTERVWNDSIQDTITIEKTVTVTDYDNTNAANNVSNVLVATGVLLSCASLWK